MMTNKFSFLLGVLGTLLALSVVGCGGGPALNEVSGKVTVDGAPPPVALEIMFHPVDNKGHTVGMGSSIVGTDGKYQIYYPGVKAGVPAGEYTVSIDVVPDAEMSDGKAPPRIPERYNSQTELKATVKPGKNEDVNFEISLKR